MENIIGNDEIKKYLLDCVGKNKVSQSYLFVGNEGIGKRLIAREFAKKILCLEPSEDRQASCKSCQCFEGQNHPDYVVVNEEGETIKIDQIREMINKVMERPILSTKKVYIINDCDKMTTEAQNCLLKTLEEPPEYVVIILITANENRLLNTIKSRCMTLKFKPIPQEVLRKYALEKLGYAQVTERLLESFNGSIGKAMAQKKNQEKYEKIETLVEHFVTDDILLLMKEAKVLYDKENITEILEYMMICMNAKKNENRLYVEGIEVVNQALMRLKCNCNFDMTIDSMLFALHKIGSL